MKIAQIANIVEDIPPKKYGGSERVIYHLTEELIKRGHDVTLFATGSSQTSARLVSVVPKPLRELGIKDLYGSNTWSMLNFGLAYSMEDRFDIIHDHHYEISVPTANLATTPVVITLHGAINPNNKNLFETLNNPYYVTISNAQAAQAPNLNHAGTVYHGLAMENYPFSKDPGSYLLFVGRITIEKGVHIAMDVAWKLQMPLIIAAKLDQVEHDQLYFRYYIKPRLKKYAKLVKWIGEVDESERNDLMSNAFCLLHAVTWPEPFGLTIIESMACGTPVIGFNKGSIPELIIDGKNGFVVENMNQMVEAVKKIKSINRYFCRQYVLENFSVKKMTEGYLNIYRKILAKNKSNLNPTTPSVIGSLKSQNQIYAHNLRHLYKKK